MNQSGSGSMLVEWIIDLWAWCVAHLVVWVL